MRNKRNRDDDETSIDMTPMLDIVFIMLIFFIVTTSFVKEAAVDIARPTTNQDTTPPENPPPLIVVSIDEGSNVIMNERTIDKEAIRANIETQLAVDPRSPVLVRVHEDAYNEVLIAAVDQAKEAGVSKVNVAKWIVGK
ncbi:ExbD/TolR family protein [Kangiella koreensis]|uniref:Biopolymer transport protein ExbD/TolR n=1 Tax=Kangiella koreensis (strain DSM 16069 / JCM 12317 / KCTC 12182 / SW-125) TaxID=523791 RepID=C7R7V3_KANKD|nr:biopolymer transporter ExbD [Kangiella koreensis]ACV27636.1 Biopolymer transport protein ExbD/TolR [Kangiella koreensis DSM 16069]